MGRQEAQVDLAKKNERIRELEAELQSFRLQVIEFLTERGKCDIP